MRTLEQLINDEDPGWVFVKQWIDSAKNKIEILPADTEKSKEALYKTQVTTRSPMGAIVYMTGGILVDNGWIRILGSQSSKLPVSLPDFNKGKTLEEFGEGSPYWIVAYDVLGGFFLLNGGGLGEDTGKVYYFAPDTLEYEALGLTYTDFLLFCFNNDLDGFYKGYRWATWSDDVNDLPGDKVFNFYPPLWTKEGKQMQDNSRKAISAGEQYSFSIDAREQLGAGN